MKCKNRTGNSCPVFLYLSILFEHLRNGSSHSCRTSFFLAVRKVFPNKLSAISEGYVSQSLPFFDKNATPVRPKFIAENKFCPLRNLVTLQKH